MEVFLPHYVNFDMNLPKEYEYHFAIFFGLLKWQFNWTEINYQTVDLDIADTEVDLVSRNDKHYFAVKFPAIKHWEIDAYQMVNNWILPSFSKVELIFKDFEFSFESDLKLDEHGYLDPVVYNCHIGFGQSYLHHENPILAFTMHQVLYFAIVIIENSTAFVGQYVFTEMLGPVMDSFLNHYRWTFYFPSLVRG